MKYTLTFLERDYNTLRRHLFRDTSVEQAAVVFCKKSITSNETRFLVKEVHTIPPEHFSEQTKYRISVRVEHVYPLIQHAAKEDLCFFWVHSHPDGFLEYSLLDDREEPDLIKPAYLRIGGDHLHGSLLMNTPDTITGRIWLMDSKKNLKHQTLDTIRVIGSQYKFFFPAPRAAVDLSAFDRNVRAFGPDMQALLHHLHVGVVGASGTGSPVVEELIRLGVGTISIYDPDLLTDTNVTRIHGSSLARVGDFKVDIMNQMAAEIGLNTVVKTYPDSISREPVAKTLRDCDIIMGCTDDHTGRSILSEISVRYYIPLIDTGFKIHSEKQRLESILGRVTVVQPGTACLRCLGIVNLDKMRAEMMPAAERARLAAEGYAPELDDPDPAVIAHTTTVGSLAVAELINKITGFTADEKRTELTVDFKTFQIKTATSKSPRFCRCGQRDVVGSGDTTPYLEIVW